MVTDSLGGLQNTLQLVAETVNQFPKSCEMFCSPKKSEFFVLRRRRTKKDVNSIQVTLKWQDIRPSKSTVIPGLLIQKNVRNEAKVQLLAKTSKQVVYIAARRAEQALPGHGILEDSRLFLLGM
ncbi:hypothetical protein HPB47_020359 [Ixodes persulcatus]|uniref:Uncharacterized protein n=1 Tax=Ixodes persulcatus TaxID=34615 RepID=A0AC60QGK8_IXOPE|nr:hypothetical protein HPB47_020359 [Ixodes persulcatus]